MIAFERLGSLVDCLECILRDSDVTVVRVKNRFAATYDPGQTAE